MTDLKYQKKLRKAERRQKNRQQKQTLKETRNYGKQKMETSKKLAIYLLSLFTIIIIYSLVAMWYFQDLSHLSTLITAFVSEVLTYLIYCAKAFFAKKNKEWIALQRDQMSMPETGVLFTEDPNDAE